MPNIAKVAETTPFYFPIISMDPKQVRGETDLENKALEIYLLQSWGLPGLIACNLFGLRTSKTSVLPKGQDRDNVIPYHIVWIACGSDLPDAVCTVLAGNIPQGKIWVVAGF